MAVSGSRGVFGDPHRALVRNARTLVGSSGGDATGALRSWAVGVARCRGCWLVGYETRGEKGSLEEQVGEVADGLVGIVFCHFLLELLDDSVIRVQLESLLVSHV